MEDRRLACPPLIEELELKSRGDLVAARRIERVRVRRLHAPVSASERRIRREKRLENGIGNRVRDRHLFDRLVVRESERSDARLVVVSGLAIERVEERHRELEVESVRQRERLRVIQIHLMMRW